MDDNSRRKALLHELKLAQQYFNYLNEYTSSWRVRKRGTLSQLYSAQHTINLIEEELTMLDSMEENNPEFVNIPFLKRENHYKLIPIDHVLYKLLYGNVKDLPRETLINLAIQHIASSHLLSHVTLNQLSALLEDFGQQCKDLLSNAADLSKLNIDLVNEPRTEEEKQEIANKFFGNKGSKDIDAGSL